MKYRVDQNFQQLTKDHRILIDILSGEEGQLLIANKTINISIHEKFKLKRCLDMFSPGPWIITSKNKTSIEIVDVPLQKKYTLSWKDSIEEKTWNGIKATSNKVKTSWIKTSNWVKATPKQVKTSWIKTSNWVKRNWPSSIF